MIETKSENPETREEKVDIVAFSRQLAESACHRAGAAARARAACAEGEAIAALLEPLGLARPLLAAARVYPLVRDGALAAADLDDTPLAGLRGTVGELVGLGRFTLPPDWQPGEALAVSQSEALRKMLLAVVSDARLVVIRIAEQLYRLRLAKAAAAAEQRALAIETREIYAALANRLGIWQLKWELEDLAFRYLEPDRYARIARMLAETRAKREASVAEIAGIIGAELAKNGIKAQVSGRPKHIYSIWRKMQRKGRALEQIFDVRAVRVLVDTVTDCYAALGAVHNRWSYLPGEFDDYIANPKGNEYRSLHTAVIGSGGQAVEVQIRTHDMHASAELGVAAHWRYKEGAAPRPGSAFDGKIRYLRGLLEPSDEDGDLLEQIRGDAFEDRVYALSPKGDVVEMPAGSTPLDFAYHVHTQIGHRCRGAKVNGRMVPLTYRVANGDRIEIITARDPQPSRDWLSPQNGYLGSSRSRAKIRSWFRQQDRDQNRRQGREILEREMARLNARDLPVDAIATELKAAGTDELCVALGAGDVTPGAVARGLQQLLNRSTDPGLPRRRTQARRDKGGKRFAIRGVDDLLCNLARCCRPVPPEPITGYITKGRGVGIHRNDCGNFANLRSRHPERVIEVEWSDSSEATYPVELVVQAFDRNGLLRDISSVLADERIGVASSQTRTDRQRMQATIELSLSVPGLAALSRVIGRLEQLPNVTSVKRAP
ncbi:MAG TPA: bifunctional (p)ppGpp synthetase/guanosine-3',5'-bis(diphosphate) 3'-pyrophosphohydrolase [Woeseiaceae bacterium]|nr:bifunctional (p)ppGpp synthetase/guanosine-3',5'-bis(diphosphate) 3'-pyrophosphohydrolase [Woeseiaceae bacterium]